MYVYMRLDSLVVSDLGGWDNAVAVVLYISVIPAFVVAELTTGTEKMRRYSL